MKWITDYLSWPIEHYKEEVKRDPAFATSFYSRAIDGDYLRKLGVGPELSFAKDFIKKSSPDLFKAMSEDTSLLYFHR